MMSLTVGLFTQVSGSGPLGPLVYFTHEHQKQYFHSTCENTGFVVHLVK